MFFGDRRTKLEKKYRNLLEESHRLSHIDRAKADEKFARAEEVRIQLDKLDQSNQNGTA